MSLLPKVFLKRLSLVVDFRVALKLKAKLEPTLPYQAVKWKKLNFILWINPNTSSEPSRTEQNNSRAIVQTPRSSPLVTSVVWLTESLLLGRKEAWTEARKGTPKDWVGTHCLLFASIPSESILPLLYITYPLFCVKLALWNGCDAVFACLFSESKLVSEIEAKMVFERRRWVDEALRRGWRWRWVFVRLYTASPLLVQCRSYELLGGGDGTT